MAHKLNWSGMSERRKAYRKKRIAWTRGVSTEARVIELIVTITGGLVGGITGGVVSWYIGDNVLFGVAGGFGGAAMAGLLSYCCVILLFYFLAPPEMADEQESQSLARMKLLTARFDEEYKKLKVELGRATKALRDYDQFETEITMLERLKEAGRGLRRIIDDYPAMRITWDDEIGNDAKTAVIKGLDDWCKETVARLQSYRDDWAQYFYREQDGSIVKNASKSFSAFLAILDILLDRLESLQKTVKPLRD